MNDDYCDCPDGSDEPGSAACSYISPLSPRDVSLDGILNKNATLAIPGFYCQNKGHFPSYLPLRSVNDGKCDYELCCDGSDEWQQIGGVTCPSKCKDIGKEWRAKEEERKANLAAALKRKKELLKEAANLRHLAENRIEELQAKVQGVQERADKTKSALEEAEKREKSRVVRNPGGKAGKLAMLAGLAKARVEELRTNLIEVRQQRDALNARVKELEDSLSSLKQDYNPNFNDDAVKRTVRAWEEYAARDKEEIKAAGRDAKERDLDEIANEDDESSGIDWVAWESEDDGNVGDVETILLGLSAYIPSSLRLWLNEKLTSFRVFLVESGILAENSDSSSSSTMKESATLSNARKENDSAQKALTQARKDLEKAEKDVKRSGGSGASGGDYYGPDDIFRALKDKCITHDSGGYTYELCFLNSVKQKPGKGKTGSNTNLGKYTGLTSEFSDEDSQGHDNSSGGVKHTVMKYENGQTCWNGPARSAMVVLTCSPTEAILQIVEREKCLYRLEVGTAAVCQDENEDGSRSSNKGAGGKKQKGEESGRGKHSGKRKVEL